MSQLYDQCPCNSGKKLKFCCDFLTKSAALTQHAEELCRKCPVDYCCTITNWKEIGEAPIVVARLLPTNNYVVGVYLIDLWCLGVKDAFFRMNIGHNDLELIERTIRSAGDGLMRITYEDARSIILSALEYAASLGFSPHKDWEVAKALIEPMREFKRNVKCGDEHGNPVYVQGPHDKNVAATARTVAALGGKYISKADIF